MKELSYSQLLSISLIYVPSLVEIIIKLYKILLLHELLVKAYTFKEPGIY